MSYSNKKPPGLATWLFRIFVPEKDAQFLMGDYKEIYRNLVVEKGSISAWTWYWTQLIVTIPLYLKNKFLWNTYMSWNYLKTAFRNLRKYRLFTLINITGLAIGLALFAFFSVYAGIALNADEFHKKADRIFGIVQVLSKTDDRDEHTAFIPELLVPEIQTEFKEFQDAVRIYRHDRIILGKDNESFYENGIYFVDPNFLDFFSFKSHTGNPETALKNPNSIVLTKSKAVKYFGLEDPIGKTLRLNNNTILTVTAILENLEISSSMQFDFLIPLETARKLPDFKSDWGTNNYSAFVLLTKGFSKSTAEERFPDFIQRHYDTSVESPEKLYLHPLLDFRMNSENISSIMTSEFKPSIYISICIGLILLTVVCINFVNLSVARYSGRVKEIGMRKVVGAIRFNLVKQFMMESILVSFLALPFSILIYEYFWRSQLTNLGIELNLGILNYPFLGWYLFFATILMGIISGVYPALVLSSFSPVKSLKGKMGKGNGKNKLSKILVGSQFTVSTILIIISLHLHGQFEYLADVDLGYNKKNIVVVKAGGLNQNNIDLIKTELSNRPEIECSTASKGIPGGWNPKVPVNIEGSEKKEEWSFSAYGIGYDFLKTLDLKLVHGSTFLRDKNDSSSLIIDKTAVRTLGLDNPIGTVLRIKEKEGTVVGVVKDFHFRDINSSITPTVMYLEREKINYILVKTVSANNIDSIKGYLGELWRSYGTELPFESTTLEDHYNDIYGSLSFVGNLMVGTSFIAILFSSVGLIGLVSLTVILKTKEIGIRKVLGSSISSVIWKLSRSYLKLSVVAFSIALPVSYYASKSILETFAYRIDVKYESFITAVFLTLVSTSIAVLSQTIKAAKANPVDSLRCE